MTTNKNTVTWKKPHRFKKKKIWPIPASLWHLADIFLWTFFFRKVDNFHSCLTTATVWCSNLHWQGNRLSKKTDAITCALWENIMITLLWFSNPAWTKLQVHAGDRGPAEGHPSVLLPRRQGLGACRQLPQVWSRRAVLCAPLTWTQITTGPGGSG